MIWLSILGVFLAFALWVELTRFLHYRKRLLQELDEQIGRTHRVFQTVAPVQWWELDIQNIKQNKR